ncbi:MAG: serine/threonine-protein kinase, partial [Jatrophihabitantaceae bacterium]
MARTHVDHARGTVSNPFTGFTDVVRIRQGTHAGVYAAREDMSHRPVALKVLNVDGVTPRALESFARESSALAALGSHPNIVTLYRSFALADRRPVLVLELCHGSLLDRLAGGRPLPVPEAVSIAIKIAAALESAHRSGVLHRDVRPANILITEFGEPALADFGLARLQASVPAPAELFDFASVHAAPELLLGQEPTVTADVYGLASTLYELLAGRPPLEAYLGESPAATILRILRDPVRPVFGADVPLTLSDLLLWSLSKDPAVRPPRLSWFAEELRRIESGNGWPRTHVLIREQPSVIERAPLPMEPSPARFAAAGSALPRPPGTRPSPGLRAVQLHTDRPRPRPGPPPVSQLTAPPMAPPPLWVAPQQRRQAERAVLPHRIVFRAPLLASLGTVLTVLVALLIVAGVVLLAVRPGVGVCVVALVAALCAAVGISWLIRPSLVVAPCHLHHRDGLARVLIPWPAVLALRPEYEPSRRPGAPHGLLVVEGAY